MYFPLDKLLEILWEMAENPFSRVGKKPY